MTYVTFSIIGLVYVSLNVRWFVWIIESKTGLSTVDCYTHANIAKPPRCSQESCPAPHQVVRLYNFFCEFGKKRKMKDRPLEQNHVFTNFSITYVLSSTTNYGLVTTLWLFHNISLVSRPSVGPQHTTLSLRICMGTRLECEMEQCSNVL